LSVLFRTPLLCLALRGHGPRPAAGKEAIAKGGLQPLGIWRAELQAAIGAALQQSACHKTVIFSLC
jgi:hypothetical protein